jgi:tRNA threonylcarbamoyladenosine biosynthesis protein TsaE
MNMTFHSAGVEDTITFGRLVGEKLSSGAVLALSGPLGAGKTVFVKGIALGLGINSSVVSPSYTIAAEYSGRLVLSHIDLYRTGSDEELELLGFDDLAYGDGVTVIEWGEKADTFLDPDTIRVKVTIHDESKRRIDITNLSDDLHRGLATGLAGAGL